MAEKTNTPPKKYTLKDKIKAMGPGLLVVGSFIGPGTVTSSTRAGAAYGYQLLWCVVFSVIAVIIMERACFIVRAFANASSFSPCIVRTGFKRRSVPSAAAAGVILPPFFRYFNVSTVT